MLQSITEMIIALPAIVIALVFHEYAHGKVADLLGDSTPYYQGRLTLNPLPHIDWLGFIMLFIFQFGWAKPVQVNPFNFKNISIKKGMMLVSLAGPGMNILLAFLGLLAYKYFIPFQGLGWADTTLRLINPLISINLILAAFNLIPLPPLDGSKILAGLLPDTGAHYIYSLEQYGPVILLLLIVSGLAGKIFIPLANLIYSLLAVIIF
ncbi:MAG: site-2 protease family protein [Syntrophomonas sp.]